MKLHFEKTLSESALFLSFEHLIASHYLIFNWLLNDLLHARLLSLPCQWKHQKGKKTTFRKWVQHYIVLEMRHVWCHKRPWYLLHARRPTLLAGSFNILSTKSWYDKSVPREFGIKSNHQEIGNFIYNLLSQVEPLTLSFPLAFSDILVIFSKKINSFVHF